MDNGALRTVQQAWSETILLPYLLASGEQDYSRPFCFGVSDRYLAADKKIMVVGQEAAGLGYFRDGSK